jgi:chromosome segregation ATPase
VLDQDDCPTVTERVTPESEEKRTFPHPTQIGRKAWARIYSDLRLIVRPVGDVPAEAVTLQADLATTKAQLADALDKVTSNDVRASLAEREVVKLGEALKAANAESEDHAQARVAWMDRVNELFAENEALKVKIAEMEEQLTAPAPTDESAAPASQTKGPAKGSNKRGG